MLGNVWKKILFCILVVACLFNIMNKLVTKIPLEEEINSAVEYTKRQEIVELLK